MTIFGWSLSSSLLHSRFRSFSMISSSSCLSTASLNHKLDYALLSVYSKKSIYRIWSSTRFSNSPSNSSSFRWLPLKNLLSSNFALSGSSKHSPDCDLKGATTWSFWFGNTFWMFRQNELPCFALLFSLSLEEVQLDAAVLSSCLNEV